MSLGTVENLFGHDLGVQLSPGQTVFPEAAGEINLKIHRWC